MNLHVFSLREHRAGAPSVDGLDTVRLEGTPPLSADVSGDTPIPRNWGDSVIEGGEVPVIVGRGEVMEQPQCLRAWGDAKLITQGVDTNAVLTAYQLLFVF